MSNRLPMQVKLSPEARAGWDQTSLDTGATLTALVEVIGLEMRRGWRPSARVVKRARAVDRERHSRP